MMNAEKEGRNHRDKGQKGPKGRGKRKLLWRRGSEGTEAVETCRRDARNKMPVARERDPTDLVYRAGGTAAPQ